MVDVYLLSTIIFFVIIGVLAYRDRKNIQYKWGILLQKETKGGQKFIDSIVNLSPKFWIVLGTIGIFVGFLVMFYGFYSLALTVQLVLDNVINEPALKLILPSPTSTNVGGIGFIGIPFWFWIIVIALVLIPHEIFHGIMARAGKIKIRSMGVFLLAIFPGAFVNPDDKQFNKSRTVTKLRIIAAGAFANFIIAGLVMAVMYFAVWPSITSPGILVTTVTPGSPAELAGIQNGSVIQKIGDYDMSTSYTDYFGSYVSILLLSSGGGDNQINAFAAALSLSPALSNFSPGDQANIVVDGRETTLTFAEHPNDETVPYMGIIPTSNTETGTQTFSIFVPLLTLLIFVSFVVGLFNLLPIYPLDGGAMVKTLTDRFSPQISKHIVSGVTAMTLVLIASSIVLPLLI